MDADGITRLCARMTLSEEEGVAVNIEGATKLLGMEKLSLCLVGKLLTSKITNRDAFRSLIARIWRTSGTLEVETVRENVYAFHFQNNSDRKRVLMGGPWNFDNALLVLEIPSGYGDFSEMSFQWSDFWIQIHNAPLICMTKNIGLMLGERIGKVKDIDVGASGDCFGKFLRVKVSIDVTKPLKRVLRVKLDGSKAEKMLLLKYERMPEYCFCCGLIGHPFRECPGESKDHEPVCNRDFAFRTWMCASSPSKDRPHGFMPKSNGPSTTRNKTQADTTGTIPIA
ncbi:hypothetical protein ACOSQ4_008020 [Xanthoceras sorbifolium]